MVAVIQTSSSGTSISRSHQLESAIPPSKIAALSSGEFVGMVADDPTCKIELKAFHEEILNDHKALKKEEAGYESIPVIRKLLNYLQVKQEVLDLVQVEMERIVNDPALIHLLLRKGN